MFVLWLYIASIVGGSEHIAKMEEYATLETCQKELARVTAEMDAVYTRPEDKTYRFECLPRFQNPGRVGI